MSDDDNLPPYAEIALTKYVRDRMAAVANHAIERLDGTLAGAQHLTTQEMAAYGRALHALEVLREELKKGDLEWRTRR